MVASFDLCRTTITQMTAPDPAAGIAVRRQLFPYTQTPATAATARKLLDDLLDLERALVEDHPDIEQRRTTLLRSLDALEKEVRVDG